MFYWVSLQGPVENFYWCIAALVIPSVLEVALTSVRYGVQTFASKFWLWTQLVWMIFLILMGLGSYFQWNWSWSLLLQYNTQLAWALWPSTAISAFFTYKLLPSTYSKAKKGICTRLPLLVVLICFVLPFWADLILFAFFACLPLFVLKSQDKDAQYARRSYVCSILLFSLFLIIAALPGFADESARADSIWRMLSMVFFWYCYSWFAHRLFNAFMLDEQLKSHPRA